MVVGAGVMLDAVRRNARLGREIRVAGMGRTAGAYGRSEPEKEEFDCYSLCPSCRYLSPKGEGDCPACGSSEWIDLQLVEMTRILRESEVFERDDPPPWAVRAGWAVVSVVVIATMIFLWLIGFWDELFNREQALLFGVPIVFGVGGFSVWVAAISAPGLASIFNQWAGGGPRLIRWAIPFGERGEPVEGELTVGEPLTSPVTKQPCAAWSLNVFLREAGQKKTRRVLTEHRSAALSIGGREFDVDALGTGFPSERVVSIDDQLLAQVVRERGLLWSDGDFTFREAIVPLGVRVRTVLTTARGPLMLIKPLDKPEPKPKKSERASAADD